MIAKLKQEAMKQGMKLMSNPKFMQMMADPRVMKTIGQIFALRGRIQSEVDGKLNDLATSLNLATKEEVQELKRSVNRVESTVSSMEEGE